MMWIGRATIVATIIAAIVAPFFMEIGKTYAFLVGGLMGLHIISLVLLEVLEPR
jgi:hypothetical protein